MSGGGGLVVIEDLEHAKARGAPVIAEVVGYGATPTERTWWPRQEKAPFAACVSH